MKADIKVYKRVFLREAPEYVTMDEFLLDPQAVMVKFSEPNSINKIIGVIKRIKDKEYRNAKKRAELPIAEIYTGGFLAIDIDDLLGNEIKINRLVHTLSKNPYCYAVKGTPSKNLVAIFKVDCALEDFAKVYYKLYLELTLSLQVKIDYLPEPERLRYLSNGELYYHNRESIPLTEFLEDIPLPVLTRRASKETVTETKVGRKIERIKRIHIEGSFGFDDTTV